MVACVLVTKITFKNKEITPQCGCVTKLTVNNSKTLILLTGISIVTPGSEGRCTIKMNCLQKRKSTGKKNPKGPKFFHPSDRSCLPMHSTKIPSFRAPSLPWQPVGRCQQGERRARLRSFGEMLSGARSSPAKSNCLLHVEGDGRIRAH